MLYESLTRLYLLSRCLVDFFLTFAITMELQEHFENQKHEWESALQVNAPAEEPVQVNPKALERMMAKRQKLLSLQELSMVFSKATL